MHKKFALPLSMLSIAFILACAKSEDLVHLSGTDWCAVWTDAEFNYQYEMKFKNGNKVFTTFQKVMKVDPNLPHLIGYESGGLATFTYEFIDQLGDDIRMRLIVSSERQIYDTLIYRKYGADGKAEIVKQNYLFKEGKCAFTPNPQLIR